jgi:hypothetical protein
LLLFEERITNVYAEQRDGGGLDDLALADELQRREQELSHRLEMIDDEIGKLTSEKAEKEWKREDLRRAIAVLRGETPTRPVGSTLLGRNAYPKNYPLSEAIADVLRAEGKLHRDQIVERLTDVFPWGEGIPVRMVGTTLGRNKHRFEEVGNRFFVLKEDGQET